MGRAAQAALTAANEAVDAAEAEYHQVLELGVDAAMAARRRVTVQVGRMANAMARAKRAAKLPLPLHRAAAAVQLRTRSA